MSGVERLPRAMGIAIKVCPEIAQVTTSYCLPGNYMTASLLRISMATAEENYGLNFGI